MFSTGLCLFMFDAGLSEIRNLLTVNSGVYGQHGVVICYVSCVCDKALSDKSRNGSHKEFENNLRYIGV
jgi:hypothetical protein